MIIMPVLPMRNGAVTQVQVKQAFTPSECDRIIALAEIDRWQEAGVGALTADGQVKPVVKKSVRSLNEQVLAGCDSGFPLDRIAYEVCNINSHVWRYELSGFVVDDKPYLMRYEGSRQDHYDWHVDIGQGPNASRKLSFSLQLSDSTTYQGGGLEFMNIPSGSAEIRRQGTLVIFPAYWPHRITPMQSGTRHVLVGWVHGPSFR